GFGWTCSIGQMPPCFTQWPGPVVPFLYRSPDVASTSSIVWPADGGTLEGATGSSLSTTTRQSSEGPNLGDPPRWPPSPAYPRAWRQPRSDRSHLPPAPSPPSRGLEPRRTAEG